ncbi:hypothetical protein K439DRAFT_1613887 [Ramaria rubella]|nr:hypothetical protein K439DRAFT_1613887 [Ramaria rubella]
MTGGGCEAGQTGGVQTVNDYPAFFDLEDDTGALEADDTAMLFPKTHGNVSGIPETLPFRPLTNESHEGSAEAGNETCHSCFPYDVWCLDTLPPLPCPRCSPRLQPAHPSLPQACSTLFYHTTPTPSTPPPPPLRNTTQPLPHLAQLQLVRIQVCIVLALRFSRPQARARSALDAPPLVEFGLCEGEGEYCDIVQRLEVLLLDKATSVLDSKLEAIVQEALDTDARARYVVVTCMLLAYGSSPLREITSASSGGGYSGELGVTEEVLGPAKLKRTRQVDTAEFTCQMEPHSRNPKLYKLWRHHGLSHDSCQHCVKETDGGHG